MVVATEEVEGWITRRRAQELLGLKSKTAFYGRISSQLASRRIGRAVLYEQASVVALAQARDKAGKHPKSQTEAAPEPAADGEQWVTATDGKAYVPNLQAYSKRGKLRRRNTGAPQLRERYVYALSDLQRIAAERAARGRPRKAGKGKKGREREAEIERVNAQLDQRGPAEGDTRAAIIAFAKRMEIETPHFHAIHITRGAHGHFVVEIEQQKTDRFEM